MKTCFSTSMFGFKVTNLYRFCAGPSPIFQLLVCRVEHGSPDRLLLPHLHRAYLLPVMADEGAKVPSHHCPLPLHHEILPCRWLQDCLHSAHRSNLSTFWKAFQDLLNEQCSSIGPRFVSDLIPLGLQRVSLGWNLMIGRVGMVAIVASLDIALSQWSFEYIDVALYTITKSTSIVFILMWAILLKLEQKHWSLIVIVLMISTGLAMFTYKSTDFVLIGFIMVLSASFLSGELCC